MTIGILNFVGYSAVHSGRHTAEQYRDAGATRLLLFPPPLAPVKAAAELEALAKEHIR